MQSLYLMYSFQKKEHTERNNEEKNGLLSREGEGKIEDLERVTWENIGDKRENIKTTALHFRNVGR